MPRYKQKLKLEAAVYREVTHWKGQSVDTLLDTLDDADSNMFRCSFNDTNMFTETVVGFIRKLMDDTVHKTIIRTFPMSHSTAYNSGLVTGNINEYKAASYTMRRVVKELKWH